jgi:hypothetical protein
VVVEDISVVIVVKNNEAIEEMAMDIGELFSVNGVVKYNWRE